MSTEQTVKCPICGNPYKFYSFYGGDQSACLACREKAEENMVKKQKSSIWKETQ